MWRAVQRRLQLHPQMEDPPATRPRSSQRPPAVVASSQTSGCCRDSTLPYDSNECDAEIEGAVVPLRDRIKESAPGHAGSKRANKRRSDRAGVVPGVTKARRC